ncbi:MAG: RecQ family ATP-dependent DNA helicase [Candidatus Kapaibacterium sp.]
MNQLNIMLNKYFGYDKFRSGQEEIIRSVLACRDTLAVMPTGGGKSICYQLPATLMNGTSIVISPLIALMKDQVDSLYGGRIPAVSINSTMSYADINERIREVIAGNYKLLYVAPERLSSNYFLSLLKNIEISFIAVDEAHCISEWGHDFRPAYMNINRIFEFIPRCPVIALTATATKNVQDDIINSLRMTNPVKIVKGFDRTNLNYLTEAADDKYQRTADIVSSTNSGSTIIYAGSRRRVELFSSELNALGIKSEPYHAGMKVLLRNAVQDRFISGKTKVIVATNAFGMGIDKDDVRNVIHVDLPLTLEAYYQEAGRAGRDGNPSNCYLLVSDGDRELPEFFIRSTYPEERTITTVTDELSSLARNKYFENNNEFTLPEPAILANKLGLDYRSVNSVYGLLERKSYIIKGTYKNNSQLRIDCSRERLSEYFDNSSDSRKTTIEALLRSVSSEVFKNFVSFDPKEPVIKHGASKSDIDELIKSMQILGMISYKSSGESAGYQFNREFGNLDELKSDTDELSKRAAFAIKKLDVVEEYAYTSKCKRNFILEYFNDYEFDGICGRCSSCKPVKKKNRLSSSKINYLKYKLLHVINEKGGNIELQDLKNNLSDIISNIGDYSDKRTKTIIVNTELNNLNKSRLIEFEDKYKSRISITQTGAEFLKHIPEQSINMARIEKDKTKSEIIFNKLVTLRREIAENAGVVPRGIISDVAMRKIAEVMPETEYDLKNVSGVSQLFVQKFARLFLHELAKIKLNPKEQKVSKVAQDALKLLSQGETFDTIKTRLFAGNLTMTANYVVEIIEAGHELPRKELVPDAVYNKIKACIKKQPDIGSREIQTKLEMQIDAPTLKMACAFAKAELGLS